MSIGTIVRNLRNLREYLRKGGVARVECLHVVEGESLKDRRVIVTGGGSGIGFAIAKRCVQEGAKVLITGRNVEKLEKARDQLVSDRVTVMRWDISDTGVAEKKVTEAEQSLGGIVDIFVNNAGVSFRQKPEAISRLAWDRVLSTNLTGGIFAAKAVCERWRMAAHHGVMLNMSSIAGVNMVVDAYGVSKSAIIQLTKGWAKEYAPFGIRINAIAPGVIVGTEVNALQRSIRADGNLICQSYPSGRFGVPDEIAELALFLISDKSAYVYGQTVVCDGGATL